MGLFFEVSAAKWRVAMDRLRNFTRQGTREFATEQFRLLLEQIAAFTPPKTLAQGRRRVEIDILKVMRPFKLEGLKDERLKKIVREGDVRAFLGYAKGIGKEKEWTTTPFSPSTHENARDRRGRVLRSGKRAPFVIGQQDISSLKKYIVHKKGNVGIARNGWSPAIRAVGGKVPAWVARHGPGHGGVIDRRNAESPEMIAINRTPWASLRDEGQRIIREAMESRATRLESALRTKIRLAAQQSGFAA